MSEMTVQKVTVHQSPYYDGCDAIWAQIDGQSTWITYEQVDGALLICSDRVDGLETLQLGDGRLALVQSIDLDYL
jgi:hypothetical protein